VAVGAAAWLMQHGLAYGQPRLIDYPSRPVRMIVPFAAGGPTDLSARLIGAMLTRSFGQGFLVENIVGASGSIGTKTAGDAAPDGLTLFVGTNHTLIISRLLQRGKAVPLSQVWAPIGLLSQYPSAIVVRAELPAATLSELTALARSSTAGLTYGSAGEGSGLHLAGLRFAAQIGASLVHVPFSGTAPALLAVSGGHVDLMYCDIPTGMPALRSGKVRAIAIAGPERWPTLPGVPTLTEAGLHGADFSGWNGLLAPSRTSPEIVNTLDAELTKIVSSDEYRERVRESGAIAPPAGSEAFARLIAVEERHWAEVIENAGLRG